MEDNFRNVLIIVSAVVIAAIFIHGLWTIRKNKNPYKLKADKKPVDPIDRSFDNSGFDQDGVGKVKVVQTALTGEIEHPPEETEIPDEPAPAPTFDEEPIPRDVEPLDATIDLVEPTLDDLPEIKLDPEPASISPVYDEPVIQSKPKASISGSRKKTISKKEAVKRNQFELNFEDEPAPAASTEQASVDAPAIETEVIVISVVKTDGDVISGAALLPSLLTLGMKYGEMNIFHRHQDNAGNGKVTFSLANMMNPGTFDLDNMEKFATQGVSLFMTLPNAGDPFEVFEQMLGAAKQLGREFNAQLLDEKRSVLTKQTEQHYVGKIREFERKKRIANAE